MAATRLLGQLKVAPVMVPPWSPIGTTSEVPGTAMARVVAGRETRTVISKVTRSSFSRPRLGSNSLSWLTNLCQPTLFHAARAEAPPAGLLAAADTPLRLAVVGLLDCRPEKELLVAKVQLAGGDLARLGMAGRSGLHITLWHGAGVKAVESNFVPESQPVTAVDVQMVGVVTVH